ncbi:hypothetical protein KKA47_02695, partial [bacterium]|nr:hypothetical protein [bacterium]
MSLFAGNMFDVFGGGFFTNSFYGNVYGGYAPKASIFEYMNGATDNSFMYNWYACMSNATTMQEENFCFAKFFNEGNWGRTSYTKPSRPNYENPPLIKQGPGGTYDAGSYVDDAIGKLEKGLATGNKKDIEHGYRDPKVFEEMSSNRNKAGYAFIDKLKEKLFEYSNERSGLVEEALDCLDDVDGVDDVEKLLAAILSPKVVLRAAAEGEKLDWNKILQNVSEADIKAFIFFVEGEAGNEINAAATGTDSAQPGAGDYLRAIAKKVKG